MFLSPSYREFERRLGKLDHHHPKEAATNLVFVVELRLPLGYLSMEMDNSTEQNPNK